MNQKRFLEMIPGLISWSFIFSMLILSLFVPSIVAYIVVFYAIYFVYEGVTTVILMLIASNKVKNVLKTDWILKLKEYQKDTSKEWESIYHAIIIPFANEGDDILRPTIESFIDNNYPSSKKILVLASEERLENGFAVAKRLKEEFKNGFYEILITRHKLIEGEIVGLRISSPSFAKGIIIA